MSKLIENIETIRQMKSLEEIVKSDYYQREFVDKYLTDIPRAASELFDIDLTWQQIEVANSFSFLGGRVVVSSGHSTGKTKLLSIIATMYILLFPKSLVRIQAPTDRQVTKFSFKEISDNITRLKKRRKINGRLVENKWAFLSKFFVINTTKIYIKSFPTSWYIEPASAPIGKSENLSGQHNQYYLLIFDEMSGIPDSHIDGSLGGISEAINACIGFSQYTRKNGRFHEFKTIRSVENGGVWIGHTLNSEHSPRVGAKELKAWFSTYNENEIAVRVKGLPPIFTEGNLLSSEQVASMYVKKHWVDELKFKTRVLSADTAFVGLRDKGVILGMRIANIIGDDGIAKLYVIIDDIQIPKKDAPQTARGFRYLKPFELKEEVLKQVFRFKEKDLECNQTYIAWDSNSGGDEAYCKLEEQVDNNSNGEVTAYGIRWGGVDNMFKAQRRKYLNQKAMGFDMLRDIVLNDRIYVTTRKHENMFKKEAENLPFEMTEDGFKMKMVGKEKLKKMSISSPDIIDCAVQSLLLDYIEESIEENALIEELYGDEEALDFSEFDEDDELPNDNSLDDFKIETVE